MGDNGNYACHAEYWDWSGYDRNPEHEYWYKYAKRYGSKVLMPMCALGETGAYMAERGMAVTAFDITPEMIAEGKKRFGNINGLQLAEGDVTDFCFDIPPVDFCYSSDFGVIHTIERVKRALACIHSHLRVGGGLVIETTLPPVESCSWGIETYMPVKQVYPFKVWKTGSGRFDEENRRHYISQTFYKENENGVVESFDHSFYMQSYLMEEWLGAFEELGFKVVGQYGSREESWQKGDGVCIFEVIKT